MKEYRDDIDAIKAVAIITVVFYHMGILRSGFLGVDLFFVVNGYLVIPSMTRLYESSDKLALLKFLERRIIRLWPLILIACVICLLIGYFVMLPDDYENLSEAVVASSLFSENILEAITTRNYWDVQNEYKPLMHLWYVGVLMEFYILTPLILWVSGKLSDIVGIDKERSDIMFLTLLTFLSFALYLNPHMDSAAKFYYLPARFWEIAIGGVIALCCYKYDSLRIPKKSYVSAFSVVGVVTLLLIGWLVQNYDSRVALIGIVLLTVVLLPMKTYSSPIDKILSLPLLKRIGRMSFSIFVWHQLILAFSRYLGYDTKSFLFILMFLSIILFLSFVSYTFIEQKVRVTHHAFARISILMILLVIPASVIYLHAGVVRDVPELNIDFKNVHRHMHAEYVDRIYAYDKPFQTNGRVKVLVVGNSFARDFANILLESEQRNNIELSYSYTCNKDVFPRVKQCDILLLAMQKNEVPECIWNSIDGKRVFGIGPKEFGVSNGIYYNKRNKSDYYEQSVEVSEELLELNNVYKSGWGGQYVDMLSPVIINGRIRIFTPNHKFISQDCRHLTQEGAKYYASLLNIRNLIYGKSNKKSI